MNPLVPGLPRAAALAALGAVLTSSFGPAHPFGVSATQNRRISGNPNPEVRGPRAVSREAPAGETLKIMTFNIFHDTYNQALGIPDWSARRHLVIRTIQSEAPDVVGLQEAKMWQVQFLASELSNYGYVGRSREQDPDEESVSILYDKDRTELIESGHFWFSDTPNVPGSRGGKDWGGIETPRMVTWVRLRLRPTGEPFYVYNTHLSSDGTVRDDPMLARARSVGLLVDRIASRSHPEDHFFVTGDFNANEGEFPIEYLKGFRCAGGPTCPMSGSAPAFRLIDAWRAMNTGAEGTRCSNAPGATARGRIDFIFTRDSASGTFSRILNARSFKWGACCASDHRAVVATFGDAEGRDSVAATSTARNARPATARDQTPSRAERLQVSIPEAVPVAVADDPEATGSCSVAWFFEGEGLTQDTVCSQPILHDHTRKLTNSHEPCANDETRSLLLTDLRAGRVLRLYDQPDGKLNDDWWELVAKRSVDRKRVSTFESSFSDDDVDVVYHRNNGLNGKVSRIRATGSPIGPVVDFYEGSNASQNLVCSLALRENREIKLSSDPTCDNDEARSLKLYDAPVNKVIRLYDSPSGNTDDDWVVIRSKGIDRRTVGSFESTLSDGTMEMYYFRNNGLNGKVSRVEIDTDASLPAYVSFYEGTGASQNKVCDLRIYDREVNFKNSDRCDNDEAKSVVLTLAKDGTVIKLYDDPDCQTGDDWTEIRVKQDLSRYVINSVEQDSETASVKVNHHHDNGLKGKVSCVKISAP